MPSPNMPPQGDAIARPPRHCRLIRSFLVRGGEMTPIIGLLVAVVAGFAASSRREVLIGVIAPMLAATAAQSWYLGSGRGHNSPATTTDDPSYWVVQLIIVALVGAVAMGIYEI